MRLESVRERKSLGKVIKSNFPSMIRKNQKEKVAKEVKVEVEIEFVGKTTVKISNVIKNVLFTTPMEKVNTIQRKRLKRSDRRYNKAMFNVSIIKCNHYIIECEHDQSNQLKKKANYAKKKRRWR